MSSSRRQPAANKCNTNQKPKPKRTKLKLRIPSKNPYGKIIEDADKWPPRDDLYNALRKGPTAIKNWQTHQIEELIVPHLNGQQINLIIQKLGFQPSQIFHKIHEKLLFEFLNNTLNSIHFTTSDSEANRKRLLNILRHSLRFIRIHHFKQLNIEILSRIDMLPKAVLRLLSDHKNQDLLCEFPINIKRQIWSHKLLLFDKEFDNILFRKYLDSKCNDDGASYFNHVYKVKTDDLYLELTKIKRANNDTLKEMVDDIGSCAILFNRFSANIEKYFIKTLQRNEYLWKDLIRLSTFRIDISCCLFDHAHKILVTEHDTIWPLIEMIYYEKNRNKTDFNKNEIDAIHKALNMNVQSLMFLCIPYIKTLLFTSYISLLEDIAHKKILPRDSKPLSLLTQILSIAVDPKRDRKNNKVDHRTLFQFNPLLIACIFVDSFDLLMDDEINIVQQYPLNGDLVKWSKESSLCAHILIYYVLFLLNKKRIQRLLQFIDIALKNEFDSSYLFAMNAWTEIHLICDAYLKSYQDKDIKWTANHKCKFVEFLICFVSQTKDDSELIEPIVNIIQNIGLFKGDTDRFMKQLI